MFHVKQNYDVIVVGGGHAGCEASLAAARMGCDTLLITLDPQKIAEMSCNPSIGGVGKGQLVKELDALGGEMGKNADATAIQFKRLNTRKGGAVQSSRCQSDKKQYALRMQKVVAGQANLTVAGAEVKALETGDGGISGVTIEMNGARHSVASKAVVITSGTFMRGLMHCGFDKKPGGRAGEGSSQGLSDHLKALGLTVQRLKTGTPPRLLRDSIDFSKMEAQGGDPEPYLFSFSQTKAELPQVECFLTYTNERTHEAIRNNLDRSPLYSGEIKGIGPRYCPSIEDKVVKFPEKNRHQLFFEPEALDSDWIYPNGISTSLPPDVQEAFVRTLPGCENVKFARPGYAVEYDCIDPRELKKSLESKIVPGLFLGGQVNGTSGYEEAAAQGLIAGINAALSVKAEPPLILSRTESYIGVMIDDLTSLGVNEPYRMFTSRAEFRLTLREDNADLRLRPHGIRIGLVSAADQVATENRKATLESWKTFLRKASVHPSDQLNAVLASVGSSPLSSVCKAEQLLKRPEIGILELIPFLKTEGLPALDARNIETLEIEVKYEGYINLQKQEIARLDKFRLEEIPANFDYNAVAGLSFELRDKLSKARPHSLDEASRISGVTPAALVAVLFHVRNHGTCAAV